MRNVYWNLRHWNDSFIHHSVQSNHSSVNLFRHYSLSFVHSSVYAVVHISILSSLILFTLSSFTLFIHPTIHFINSSFHELVFLLSPIHWFIYLLTYPFTQFHLFTWLKHIHLFTASEHEYLGINRECAVSLQQNRWDLARWAPPTLRDCQWSEQVKPLWSVFACTVLLAHSWTRLLCIWQGSSFKRSMTLWFKERRKRTGRTTSLNKSYQYEHHLHH